MGVVQWKGTTFIVPSGAHVSPNHSRCKQDMSLGQLTVERLWFSGENLPFHPDKLEGRPRPPLQRPPTQDRAVAATATAAAAAAGTLAAVQPGLLVLVLGEMRKRVE